MSVPSRHTLLGVLALVPLAATTLLRVLRNAPVDVPGTVRAAGPLLAPLAAVVPALALFVLGATTDRFPERVALLAAGVFPVLAAVDGAAWMPAAAALLLGGGGAVVLRLRERSFPAGPTAVVALGLAALAGSLVGGAGVATVPLRSLGAAAAFAALAALPLARSLDAVGFVAWIGVSMAVGWWAASAPFVAGAVTLVAFGAGDVPFVLLATGVGGGVAVALASLRHRRPGVAVGAALLLVAGAPVTIARAAAVVLALLVLVATWDGHGDRDPESDGPTGGEAHA